VEVPIQRVEEDTNLTITVETPISKNIVLLKDSAPITISDHLHIKPLSSTTTEIEIIKAKPEDAGEYSVVIDNKEQPLMKLQVIPKPVVRKEMQLPKTQFNEKGTLTIVCQFDARPEEAFIFLHNDQPIIPDNRVTTTIEDNKYTIVVKDLRPEEDEGVYTLKSDHLILDTPSISVLPEEKKPQTETTTVEEEEEIITISPQQQQPEIQQKEVGLFFHDFKNSYTIRKYN
jgi:hypothetical protein